MSNEAETHRIVDYRVEDSQYRRLCDPEPVIEVRVYQQVRTVEYRPDGSTVTVEDRERLVKSWTYQHEGGNQ